MPIDVFEHHDRIVDDEADGDRQRHQREIVETVMELMHQRESAEDRHRDGDARDDRRPEIAQEQKDHGDHERDRDQHGELHIIDRGANGLRAVEDGEDLDRGWHRRLDVRHLRFDVSTVVDDIGARLLEDQKLNAALAVLPRCDMRVFRRIDGDGRCP